MAKETIKTVSLEKTLKFYEQDLTYQFGVDSTAQYVMECLEDKVSPKLLDVLNAMLLGFNDDMQLEIADDLLDFAYGQMVHTTGCPSADAVLYACYTWIAEEKGVDFSMN
jgi:hypothetical protein